MSVPPAFSGIDVADNVISGRDVSQSWTTLYPYLVSYLMHFSFFNGAKERLVEIHRMLEDQSFPYFCSYLASFLSYFISLSESERKAIQTSWSIEYREKYKSYTVGKMTISRVFDNYLHDVYHSPTHPHVFSPVLDTK